MAMVWWEEERVGLVVLLLLLGAQAQQCQEGAGQSRLITVFNAYSQITLLALQPCQGSKCPE